MDDKDKESIDISDILDNYVELIKDNEALQEQIHALEEGIAMRDTAIEELERELRKTYGDDYAL